MLEKKDQNLAKTIEKVHKKNRERSMKNSFHEYIKGNSLNLGKNKTQYENKHYEIPKIDLVTNAKYISFKSQLEDIYNRYLDETNMLKHKVNKSNFLNYDWRVKLSEIISKESIIEFSDNQTITIKRNYLSDKILKMTKLWILIIEAKRKLIKIDQLVEIFRQAFCFITEVNILKDFYLSTMRKISRKNFNDMLSKIYGREIVISEKFFDILAVSILDNSPIKDEKILKMITKSPKERELTKKNSILAYLNEELKIDNPKNFEIISPFKNDFLKIQSLNFDNNDEIFFSEFNDSIINNNQETQEQDSLTIGLKNITIDQNIVSSEFVNQSLNSSMMEEKLYHEDKSKFYHGHSIINISNLNIEEEPSSLNSEDHFDKNELCDKIICNTEDNINSEDFDIKIKLKTQISKNNNTINILNEEKINFQKRKQKRKKVMGLYENDLPSSLEGGSIIFEEKKSENEISKEVLNKYFSNVVMSIIMKRKSLRLLNKLQS